MQNWTIFGRKLLNDDRSWTSSWRMHKNLEKRTQQKQQCWANKQARKLERSWRKRNAKWLLNHFRAKFVGCVQNDLLLNHFTSKFVGCHQNVPQLSAVKIQRRNIQSRSTMKRLQLHQKLQMSSAIGLKQKETSPKCAIKRRLLTSKTAPWMTRPFAE